MIKAVFFDINETILDLKVINKKFDKYFESQHVGEYWFSKLLHTSNIMSIMNEYVDFNKLAEIVLENIFYENDKEITKDIKSEILGTFKTLPIYPDVRESLEILKENGIKIIALSNSSLEMMKIQLQSENIKKIFDNYYSVDSVKKYKPYSDIYEYVADQENLSFEEIIMVASHDWDLFGAKKVGMRTAYINRKKERFNPTYPNPDISERNLVSLAKKIINIK